MATKFSEAFNELRVVKTVEDVLENIARKNGWGKSDEEILAAATAEDFYRIFKNTSGEQLSSYVDSCLQFGRFTNSTEQQKQIAENTRSALIRIGSENKLNEIRVKRYGISLM